MISVCMATYNGAQYIQQQISSILLQLGDVDELIISDDASSDRTLAIIDGFKDTRIKILPGKCFRDPVKNFEYAIRHASGDYIFLADQDDIWHPEKVSKYKARFAEGYDLVLSDCIIVNEDLVPVHESFFQKNGSEKGLLKNLIKNSYIGCCMAFSRAVMNVVLPFPARIPMHDMWIGIAAELTGKVIFMEDKLLFYRRHGANESTSGDKSKFGIAMKLRFRLNIIRYLPLLITRIFRMRMKSLAGK